MPNKTEWKPFDDCCPDCGNDVEVLTSAPAGECYDGDEICCIECGFKSAVSVYEDGTVTIQESL